MIPHRETVENATILAIDGMRRALEHADDATLNEIASVFYPPVSWGDLAYAFLRRHAERNYLFTAHEVCEASVKWGMIQPPTEKAWGAVYKRAQAAGMIEMAGVGRNPNRHNSICPRWRSTIYRDAA